MTSKKSFAVGTALAIFVSSGVAAADSSIDVQLLDKTSKPVVKDMAMKLDVDHVPAGTVTFHVKNLSKSFIHEMVVVPVSDPSAPLPYNEKKKRVNEEAMKSKGEVSELGPGKSGKLTVDLAPGSYKLICNIPDHFHQGMWADLTVTP